MTKSTHELTPLLQTSTAHQQEDIWPPTYDDLAPYDLAPYVNDTTDLQWNRVSNLETIWLRGRHLTIRLPLPPDRKTDVIAKMVLRPHKDLKNKDSSKSRG
ncbi:hypothetical protein AVEN_65318-1 [Araneus ventricosus]|uniref:Uncharacterized protein n=1 Tax=Araneus ventricosus TaxID=182803 RepID=A0A4Y2AG59_ARAVE|nr:hypothetical protein AVEN_65318-1 [Araneus ventricosus]